MTYAKVGASNYARANQCSEAAEQDGRRRATFAGSVKSASTGGLYLNFAGFGEEKDELVRPAYGPNYAWLVELKNAYDPTNLFRLNQTIRP
jgi:FAD/FMN-containing dehydrogenase